MNNINRWHSYYPDLSYLKTGNLLSLNNDRDDNLNTNNLNLLFDLPKEVFKQILCAFIKDIIIPSPLNQSFMFQLKFMPVAYIDDALGGRDNKTIIPGETFPRSLGWMHIVTNKEELKVIINSNLDTLDLPEPLSHIYSHTFFYISGVINHCDGPLIQKIWFQYKETDLKEDEERITKMKADILPHTSE